MRNKSDLIYLQTMAKFALPVSALAILPDARTFKQTILTLISNATTRIYLCALYLQDDTAGREILVALYQAKQANPALDVKVFVDFHRAQRGLIGEDKHLGNAEFYRQCHQQYPHPIDIYGVPVKSKELLGVLLIKGFIFDNTVLYSGASINDIYLHQQDRYRCDRYHQIQHAGLADTMVKFFEQHFVQEEAVKRLTDAMVPSIKEIKREVLNLKRNLANASYNFKNMPIDHRGVAITPLIGLGVRGNQLNKTIRAMFGACEQKLVLLTPYFNLPPVLAKDIRKLLKKDRVVTIVIGDKTANDFYIPPDLPFSRIGGLPYIYEANLRRFVQNNQKFINRGLLNIHLWRHEHHSFHLKGVSVDDQFHLLTGNNLNPRAWRLDIENGLLIQDPQHNLKAAFDDELAAIIHHTHKINNYRDLQTINDYPPPVRKLLRTIRRTKLDAVIKNII